MRHLILLRGSPASGKSTFLKNNNLYQYVICADEIRLLYQSPVLQLDGTLGINQKNDKKVWETLYFHLEERMKRGEFIIVDATHSKTSDFNKYKAYADSYRYRIWCVDFTDVPLFKALVQNMQREEYKRVPQAVINTMYERFKTEKVPSGITVIKPDEFQKTFQFQPLDFSSWKRIHHIGDMHSCYTVLQKYLNGELKKDELYIFCGDYLDRGIEHAETLKWIMSISDLSNVILLEGNHERHIWAWACNSPVASNEFKDNTQIALEKHGIDKKTVRQFYRKIRQMAYYTYDNKTIVVTHGGISIVPDNFNYIATEQLIKGVGVYKDEIDRLFTENTGEQFYQIHGHRNAHNFPIQVSERCWNLEGKVEFGGELRVVTLDHVEGFKCHEIKNEVYNKECESLNETCITINDNGDSFLKTLRSNSSIMEKDCGNNISSFNFRKNVFYDKTWDAQNIKARGLFINTKTSEIVARSYNKFFNIDERVETELKTLEKNLAFPVSVYVKENGYLGINGYNSENKELVLASKSMTTGDFANWFRDIYYDITPTAQFENIKNFLSENNATFVFEILDPFNDPHIIKYDKKGMILLDIIKRTPEYNKLDYETVIEVAKCYGWKYKDRPYILNNWTEFINWYYKVNMTDYLYNGKDIEGFVIEDRNGFMTKIKLPYYTFWKHMRTVKDRVANGKDINESYLTSSLSIDFVAWLKTQTPAMLEKDIITLREKFYADYENKK